ncbi:MULTISPECIES: hypothetical protein [Mesorhizobium]|uniref:Uncharacterized protein n=2 Tax=Mesorhizobium TaxID=68287 RepID=A0A1A5HQW4_RHILI|nr:MULTISPECIES: hypothetical protein [Mesorhizobium]MBE1708901.1 hypothetical protein [Mesorhizobium japonicum]MBE1716995.1 hypothetical protein [Mesorhizobium japonicum]MUT22338.1 hypothetical protein [Mesorhizobium japonicum]MUT29616.1 hypothetical protein [Mesorhizobium japonicum]OBP69338.1 hypothetical protein BAE42_22645 [Mesorhizobium loti]
MPRYATIITDDDGREIVSAIGEFEGAPPQVRLGRVEAVASGVLIGMVRDAGGGFGFPQAGIGGHAISLVLARLKAQASVAKRAGAAKPAAVAKPKRAKRAKKRTRSRKPTGSMPKASKAASDTAAKTMDQADG